MKRIFAVSALLALSLSVAFAQTMTTGEIAGVVTDQTGAVVASATVTLHNLDAGTTQTDVANAQGAYRFTLLKPGNYTVQASTSGLKTDVTRVTVEVGQAASVNLTAKVEATQQVVEVNASSTIIQTENANLNTTVTTQQIQDLPTPGGDITTVAFTIPGIVMSTGMGYGNFSSHGLPGVSNLFTMNGNDYNDAYLNLNNSGASNLLLGQNEIQEASVVQNGYSVQYGREAGANVNYITKSGSNAVHADLLYNFNNHLMNANDFFNNLNGNERPYSVSQQWGADIGGPAIKNKLFWYADSEGLYYTLPATGVVTIPSAAFEAYTLSKIQPAQDAFYNQAFGIWNGANGVSRAVPVTNGNGPLQDATNRLGCGQLAGTTDPGAGVFGTSVGCAQAWQVNGLNHNNEWFNTARADWNITDNQKIYFRFKGDHGIQATGTDLLTPALNDDSIQPQYEGQINYTFVISPTKVNNLIFSTLWYAAIFGPTNLAGSEQLFPSYFGFNDGGSNSGTFYGVGTNWGNYPQGRHVGQWQVIDDYSWTVGSHQLKIGGNFRRNRVTDYGLQTNTEGSYTFNSLVDFADGMVNSATGSNYTQNFTPILDAHIRTYNVGLYAMDEWAVKSNLKLTLGIRFDRTGNPECLDKCFNRLDQPFTSSQFQMGASIPYDQSITTGLSTAYYGVDGVVADPRLGFVYSPGFAKGTVVRGGFGIFSDLAPAFIASNVFHNGPYPYGATVYNGLVDLGNDPSSAKSAALAQYNTFQTGFFAGDTLAQLNAALQPIGFSGFGYYSVPSHFSTPQYLEWSFEIEQPLGQKNVFVATYSGNHGYNLLINNPFPNAYVNTANFPNGFGGLPTSAPDPRFLSVTQLTNQGISNYDGLSVTFRRALSYGFSGEVSYTWSHALDDISNGGSGLPYSFCSGCSMIGLPSPYISQAYGNSDYDIRNNLLADFIWNTPWHFQNKILSTLANWTVGGKFFVRSGTPFSIYDGNLAGLVSPNIGTIGFTGGILASYAVGGNSASRGCTPGAVNTPCFTASSFVPAGSESTWGDVGRNSFYGPGYTDVDATLFKNFTVRERYNLKLGVELFNSLNHPNFQNPNANVAQGGFGLITATAIPPTSAYGAFQGSAVSGRVMVITGRFTF